MERITFKQITASENIENKRINNVAMRVDMFDMEWAMHASHYRQTCLQHICLPLLLAMR